MNVQNIIGLNTKDRYWIFLSVLVFLTLFMMFCNGLSSSYSGYDFFFHYRRLDTLIDALQHGTFPIYIDYSNVEGYGYFTKGFYSDVILIPFAIVGLFTSTYFAYDFMIFTMTILCGVLMYHTVKVIYRSSYTAAISAILYTFAVYRLYDIYHRGATAEALSFTILPIIFLGLYYIIQGDYKKWYILAIGYSLLIYTHIIASVLMFITLIILLIIYYKPLIKEPKRILYLCMAGLVTVAITASYILPLSEQLSSNSFWLDAKQPGGGAGYGKVGFNDILWGFLSGGAYQEGKLWTGVGIILTLVVLLRVLVKDKKSRFLRSVDIGVIIGLFYIIATSRIFPWGRFPFSLLGFIQYPWRLYEFVSYFFAIAGGYYLTVLFTKKNHRIIVAFIVVIATMATTYIHSENFKHLYHLQALQLHAGKTDEKPSAENRYHLIGAEYFPAKMPALEYIWERGEIVETKNQDTRIDNLKREYNKTIVNVVINQPDTITLPLIYYYGYYATVDGENLPVYQSEFGLVKVPVNKPGEIVAYYKGTTIQIISYIISLAGTLGLIVFIILQRRRKENE